MVQLLWSTASELNNQGFEIERSINDADNFVTIGFVDGKGVQLKLTIIPITTNPN